MDKSGFFDNVEPEKEKQYIPPDYSSEPDENREIGEVFEGDTDIDESEAEDENDGDEKPIEPKTQTTENQMGSGNAFGPPSVTPSFGGGSSSPWGTGFGSGGSSPWNQRQPSSPWGQGGGGGSIWGGGGTSNPQKEQINRNKQIIFCDFLDCIVETYDSQGRPGFLPRDIYDLKPRFEVWQKIAAFNPKQVYPMIPVNLIPNTTGDVGWIKTLEYFCCALSAFLQLPPGSCRILAQTLIGQPKEALISSVLNSGMAINKKDVIYIGIYSGLAGQSNKDQVAAQMCGIDYVDLGILLNNMY